MTDETGRTFNTRRAADEKAASEHATDIVQSIVHDQLSHLHSKEALKAVRNDEPRNTALEVTAVDGLVEVSDGTGNVTHLSPNAAALTSDLLLSVARDAGRQHPDPGAESATSADATDKQKGADGPENIVGPLPSPEPTAAERSR